MVGVRLDYFQEGRIVRCDNCNHTATIQADGGIPNGWFVVIDSQNIVLVFCRISCIVHYVTARMKDMFPKDNFVVEKTSRF